MKRGRNTQFPAPADPRMKKLAYLLGRQAALEQLKRLET
jgi:hypothetical protein